MGLAEHPPVPTEILIHALDEQPSHADQLAESRPCRNPSVAVSGYTPLLDSRPHFHALPDGPGTVRGQLLPSLSAALLLLPAWRSFSVFAHPRGHAMLSGGLRLYAVRLRRDLIQGRSRAESGAEVRSSTVHPIPSARLQAGHPSPYSAGLESSPQAPCATAQLSTALKQQRQLR